MSETALASVFADPQDLDRYHKKYSDLLASGSSPGDARAAALKVGDDGHGRWGDNTASLQDPIVAFSDSMPGAFHNRLVQIQGPNGSVVARIGDSGAPHGRIDLNPAAALAVGHPGGLTPVKWNFLDGYAKPPPAAAAGSSSSLAPAAPTAIPNIDLSAPDGPATIPSVPTASDASDSSAPGDFTGDGQTASTDSAYGGSDASSGDSQQPQIFGTGRAAPKGLKPPPAGKVIGHTADGGIIHDTGVTYYPKDRKLVWTEEGTTYVKREGNQTMEYPSKSSKPAQTMTMQDPETGLVRRFQMGADGKLQKIPVEGEQELPPPPEGASGDDAIKSLSTQDQDYVKRFAKGDLRTQTGMRSNPIYARLRPYVLAYDPNFKESLFDNIKTVTAQYNNPSITAPGGQIASVNTLLKQLPKFNEYANALNNDDFRAYNAAGNYLNTATGKPEVNNFLGMRDNIVREMARFLKGGVPDSADYKAAEQVLSSANSKAQLDGMIKKVIPDTILPKLTSLDYEYSQQTNGRKFPGVMTPEAAEAMKKLGIENPFDKKDSTQSSPSPTPTPTGTPIDPGVAAAEAKRILADPNASSEDKAAAQQTMQILATK